MIFFTFCVRTFYRASENEIKKLVVPGKIPEKEWNVFLFLVIISKLKII